MGIIGEIVAYIKQLIEEIVAFFRDYNDKH